MNLETELYVEQPEDQKEPSFSEEGYRASIEGDAVELLEEKLLEAKNNLAQDAINLEQKKNLFKQSIEAEALLGPVRYAESYAHIHERQVALIKEVLNSKRGKRKTKVGGIGSFFGF